VDQGEILNEVYSLYFSDDDFGKYNQTSPPSTMILGGWDLEAFAKPGITDFKWMRVVDYHGWGVPLYEV
jgi:hypothetical protein